MSRPALLVVLALVFPLAAQDAAIPLPIPWPALEIVTLGGAQEIAEGYFVAETGTKVDLVLNNGESGADLLVYGILIAPGGALLMETAGLVYAQMGAGQGRQVETCLIPDSLAGFGMILLATTLEGLRADLWADAAAVFFAPPGMPAPLVILSDVRLVRPAAPLLGDSLSQPPPLDRRGGCRCLEAGPRGRDVG